MRRMVLLMSLVCLTAKAEDHSHHAEALSPSDAQIVVTINPEARVSAVWGAPLPAPITCGTPTEIKVRVINKGFVTAPLRAALIGDGGHQMAVRMDDAKLTGQPEDHRILQLVAREPHLADVTLEFSLDNDIGNLGGRNRVHFLLSCLLGQIAIDERRD